MEKDESLIKKVTPLQAAILLLSVVGWIIINARFGTNNTASMAMTWTIIFILCTIFKLDYNTAQNAGFNAIRKCMNALFILICVGMLVASLIAAGTIPTLIYFGLSIINPKIFLLCALLITSIMSVFTGTSYGSAASAGVAMMGIGLSMGLPAGMVAGAILCGATFGDKISPLSDTTNVCPALCGGDLFKHIRSQMYTTLPAYILCIIAFTVLGFSQHTTAAVNMEAMEATKAACAANFNISVLALLPLLFVIVLLLLRIDVVPTICAGTVFAMIIAMITQGQTFTNLVNYLYSGYSISSGDAIVDKLMNRGGITSMMSTIVLMMFAIGMGAMLEHLGVMDVFMNALRKKINSVFTLVASTMIVSYLGGALTMAMTSTNVLTAKLMSPFFKARGIAPEVCSRTMEDTGTIGGPLMPWHTNSIYYCGVLGVTWAEFAPYLVLNYTVPIFAIICSLTGFGIFYVNRNNERISKEEWMKEYNCDAKGHLLS